MYMVGMNPPALPHELHLSNVGEWDPMSSVVKTKYSNWGLNKTNIVSGLWDLGLIHPLVYFIYFCIDLPLHIYIPCKPQSEIQSVWNFLFVCL